MTATRERTFRRRSSALQARVTDRKQHDGVLDESTSWMTYLTPRERKELDNLLEGVRPVMSFRRFIQLVKPEFHFYWHCNVLIRVLQEVADGKKKRVMIFEPPRHGKSELVSRLFPAYYLYRNRKHRVGLVSYGAELAYELAADARNFFFSHDDGKSTASKAVKNWRTTEGGGMWADGIGGTLTGKGANLLLLDDPTKNAQEAASLTTQRRNVDWFSSTFSSRKEPGAAMVIVGTRWHEADLLGWLLAQERTATEEGAERWHIVCFQAIRDTLDDEDFSDWCTVEPDPRKDGEALCPERFTVQDLLKEKAKGRHYFAALYQQRPRPREGTMFRWEWFKVLKEPYLGPADRVFHFDMAGTDGEVSASADYTAGCCMLRTPDGRFIIHRVSRGQFSPARRDNFIRNEGLRAAQDFGHITHFHLGLEQETGVDGGKRVASSIRTLGGFILYVEPAGSKNKALRAEPFASQAELGNVWIVEGDWNGDFLDELCSFPDGGIHDDQVDAASGAFNKLIEMVGYAVPDDVVPVLGELHDPYGGIV